VALRGVKTFLKAYWGGLRGTLPTQSEKGKKGGDATSQGAGIGNQNGLARGGKTIKPSTAKGEGRKDLVRIKSKKQLVGRTIHGLGSKRTGREKPEQCLDDWPEW